MKTLKMRVLALLAIGVFVMAAFAFRKAEPRKKKIAFVPPKGCVFRTVMGEEASTGYSVYKTPEVVLASVEKGLTWISKAQNPNGGWGAGSHSRQDITNPHLVETDPATTAMVGMALLRSGHSLTKGEYSTNVRLALEYLLSAVESAPANSSNITPITGTQIQTKLGANIDVILTSQFLSNILDQDIEQSLRERIRKAQNICVDKIQGAQGKDGAIAGSGWAGVLQSSFATNALEAAESNGADVDKVKLAEAREFQKKNYNAKSGAVNTDMGAGVVLYSVTGSARATAKEARKVEEEVQKAKDEGKIAANAPTNAETLEVIGYSTDEALRYSTSYEVYESAKVTAQREDVMSGFGNNGGEEFLSYLQTGESMIINKDDTWQKWYDNVSGKLLNIQNANGSWQGHHCITSPVFCTATCLLILAVNNDIEKLIEIGAEK
jgi:hypothetical protein